MTGTTLIIGAKDSGEKNNPELMRQKLTETGLSVEVAYWEELVFDIATNDIKVEFDGVDPKTFSLVIALGWYQTGEKSMYRDIAYSLSLYLGKNGVSFWNSEMAHQRSTTKLSAIMQLALEGIDVPRTVFSLDSSKLHEEAVKQLEFPVVVKAIAASRGRDNHLVQNQNELNELLQSNQINDRTVQPFLPNDHDLRVVCFNGEPQLIIKRSRASDDTHLNNTSQGGKSETVGLDNVPAELLTNSRKICKIMGREMAGIDFLPASDVQTGYVCLEVNAIPQLTSGSLVNEKMQRLAQAIKDYSSN